ncbi:penicillin acylase family protein [Streptomyces sp. NPDC056716]|uniref:penicillin acylase family protein n=1 Tax=unclassified Streptomyces TaxID=2593676 RepID=UPI0036759764
MSTEIYRDAHGIPHLRAPGARELAHAQGRVTALDRAWQLETQRHRLLGTSASFLGPSALPWDVLARRARLADTARRCFDRLAADDPETADWVGAYVDGVHASLAEGARRAPEFAATGLAPGRWEPWTPLGVWLATHVLSTGLPLKLWREEAIRHLGPGAVGLFAADGPGTTGGNGWLVAGERTVTGHAVLAGAPHQVIEDPGVHQQIRLACPEFDVLGLAVPGVPGIAHFGHTGTVAWAITDAMADHQDLYRERLRRTGAGVEALGPDGTWRRARLHTESVAVAGEERVPVEVIETERGPVIAGGPEGLEGGVMDGLGGAVGGRGDAVRDGVLWGDAPDAAPGEPVPTPLALSLRHPPRVTSDLGFAALLPLLRARTVADVDRALDRWAEPVNVVLAADTEGGTLHRVAGRVPTRAAANRVRPVPAWEPGHEWTGWHETPRAPLTGGIAVMANERGLATPLGVEFAAPHRADRITARLAERDRWSAADMAALHTDTVLISAGALLDGLAALPDDTLTPGALALRARLLRWDRRMAATSRDAAAFAALRSGVVRRLAAHPAFAPLTEPPAYPEPLQPWLALVPRIGPALAQLLTAEHLYGIDRAPILREALEETARRPEPTRRTWGETHRLVPWRALGTAPGKPYARPGLSGDHDCVLSTSSVPGVTDLAVRGPAARYVWDLARREDSRWVVPLGASGVPGSPHHRDQLPLWLRGELVPVVTDWDRLVKESDG